MTTPRRLLLSDFRRIRYYFYEIVREYQTFHNLYSLDPEFIVIMNEVAPVFSHDLANILQRDWILKVCRISDPAKSHVKGRGLIENLTINHLQEQIIALRLETPALKLIHARIMRFAKTVRPARNRFIAHVDRETVVLRRRLGGFQARRGVIFLRNLQLYCDELDRILGRRCSDFSQTSRHGDILSLMMKLRDFRNDRNPYSLGLFPQSQRTQ